MAIKRYAFRLSFSATIYDADRVFLFPHVMSDLLDKVTAVWQLADYFDIIWW